jgi:hypothetical protein
MMPDMATISLEQRLELEYKVRCYFQVLHNTRVANKLHYVPPASQRAPL